jgi:hypothetical protein
MGPHHTCFQSKIQLVHTPQHEVTSHALCNLKQPLTVTRRLGAITEFMEQELEVATLPTQQVRNCVDSVTEVQQLLQHGP